MKLKDAELLGRKVMTNLDSIFKSRDITLPTKVFLVKALFFPVVMYGFESWTVKKKWAPKYWCFWSVVLEKPLESPLDCKEIQPVCSKGDQSWVFIGRTDAETETPILWPPHVKSWLIVKNPDAVRDWGQEEKGSLDKVRELVMDREAWRAAIHVVSGHIWVTEVNWTDNRFSKIEMQCDFINLVYRMLRK